MRLQFKVQEYQTQAVDAVVDCFAGQPYTNPRSMNYQIDPGKRTVVSTVGADAPGSTSRNGVQGTIEGTEPIAAPTEGFRNAEIVVPSADLVANIATVQRARNLTASTSLASSKAAPVGVPNLDVEMETGTGKTYVYIKTMMEMYKRYGWSKFIVVVPSIAIREGVKKSFDITADHFQEAYGTKPRAFIYNSSRLNDVEGFASDAGVQVMIINTQAFNRSARARTKQLQGEVLSTQDRKGLKIFRELDSFQSRRPIDIISATRPILILDEPQKIGDGKSLEALQFFRPLAVLRYSATHKVEHNKVHRLDAVDAYNDRLVKKIEVRGITVKGLAGSTAYLYVDGIEVGKGLPKARVEIEVQGKNGITRKQIRVEKGSRLHDMSNEIEAYRDLFVSDIDAIRDVVVLNNGEEFQAGFLVNDVTEETKRRIQIREVIRAHLDKERELFAQGIKVLSLFFIGEVKKYRDYEREATHGDTKGEYARMFEEEYGAVLADVLSQLDLDGAHEKWREHVEGIGVEATHEGYFAIDKKGLLVNPKVSGRGDDKGEATDVSAYDLILKDKERLLSFETPLRFIFSHSALREGWDNPNVFTLGMLKKSDNTISRRQEIGRGLRLAVDSEGVRQDNPATVHDINELTVVTDESYTTFVEGLQKEIAEAVAGRPRKASAAYFTGKTYVTNEGESVVTEAVASALYKYLVKNDFVNEDDTVAEKFKAVMDAGGPWPEPTSDLLKGKVDLLMPIVKALYMPNMTPGDGRKPKAVPLNEANFARKEFQNLWRRINHKAVYQVQFDTDELVAKCVEALDANLRVVKLTYTVETGEQTADMDAEALRAGESFTKSTTATTAMDSARSQVLYDLLGEIAAATKLTRRTASKIMQGIRRTTFAMFKANPEQFIADSARLINEQKATVIVEHLTYSRLDERFDSSIFTANQSKQDFANAGAKLKKHIYDYVVTDSKVERDFVTALDTGAEVAVYAKLPRGFFIPTPVGNYNPDWAIAFNEGSVRHVYFVAETKGSLSSLELRGVEQTKISCAKKFFKRLAEMDDNDVVYDVVDTYNRLMDVVGVNAAA
ncbi:MAG: DEAD/DEAH box helicase family protein [Cellulomonadaceae bacterium]|jgi:type III restriction enzyme|nr:DEAD/DEAH box helicase family protein [Cellulomonadaceae bacterium]